MDIHLKYVFVCHKGKVRASNQDNYLCEGQCLPADHNGEDSVSEGTVKPEEPALFAVFDGMGGEEHGEMASYIAAQTFQVQSLKEHEKSLEAGCLESNRRIVRFAEENSLDTCGTTAAMLLFDASGISWCNIGDSRIYRIRKGKMEQISVDDSFPVRGSRKAPLLSFLGIPEHEMRIEPHTGSFPAIPGEIFLICSDGLTDMLHEQEILDIIQTSSGTETGNILLQTALDAGGRDNITFFLIHVEQSGHE